MSVKEIIQHSLEKNPLAMKQALEAEMQERIRVALEAKMTEAKDEDEDDEDDDEDDEDEDDDEDDMDESVDLSDYTVEELEDFIESEEFDELDEESQETLLNFYEGSIKGSGTDRKAVLKKAYRAGEQKTRDYYKNKMTKDPRTSDKGVKKAFAAGKNAGDGSPTRQGAARSASHDRLKGTEHGNSTPSDFGKTHYKTQTHGAKMTAIKHYSKKGKLPEDFDFSDFEIEELVDFMQTEDFNQLDEISKTKMGQYIKRAADDKETQKKRAAIFDKKGIDADKDRDMYSAWDKANKARKKADNRSKFISKAVDRLTK